MDRSRVESRISDGFVDMYTHPCSAADKAKGVSMKFQKEPAILGKRYRE